MASARHCEQCNIAYSARRSTSRFCSTACRVANHRDSPKKDRSPRNPLRRWLEGHAYAAQGRLSVAPEFARAELNAEVEKIKELGLRTVLPAYTAPAFLKELSDAGLKWR